MRRLHCTLRSSDVTREVIDRLVVAMGLKDFGQRVTARLLAGVWVAAAAVRGSLSSMAREHRGIASYETLRRATKAQLPSEVTTLERQLHAALTAWMPRELQRWPCPVAIDLTKLPFYGKRNTRGLYRGQAHAGTKTFWAVATCCVVEAGRRFTLGLVHVSTGDRMADVVEQLLEQARDAGVKPKYVLLDRGFYSAHVIDLLQRKGVPFIIPMIRRGREHSDQGPTGTQRFFTRGRSRWGRHTWTARHRQGPTVHVRVAMISRRKQPPQAFAVNGLTLRPNDIAQAYRRRFGIESSYRQLRQCLSRSTTDDLRSKLLQVGIALLLRNVWVGLNAALQAARETCTSRPMPTPFRLSLLLRWLPTIDARVHLKRELTFELPPPTTT